MARRYRTVPPALAALLAAVAIAGVAWALLVPPFQAPDEAQHFAYAQSLATRFALPGDPARAKGLSSDQEAANSAVRAVSLGGNVEAVRPEWSSRAFQAYLARARKRPSQSDGGGPNPQAVDPPLYYLYSDLAYWASGSDNLFGRLYAMRVWGVLLLVGNALAAWLLAGEVFGRRRLAQLMCAAVCGLVPTETFVATSVNPDSLMVPLWTTALWLGARLITRGWRAGNAVALCATTAAAVLTKATSYALVPAVLLALVVAFARLGAERRRAAVRSAGVALVVLASPVLAWVAFATAQGRSAVNTVPGPAGSAARSGFPVGGFVSYVWQYYLPRLPFLRRSHTAQGLAVYEVWLKQGWATFGWLNVRLPGWVYVVLGAITAAIGVLAAVFVSAMRGPRRLWLVAFLALALVALLFGLHLTEFRDILAGQQSLLQGRYLLPVLALFGLAAALVVTRIPVRWRGVTAGTMLAALLLLQILSLATVAKTYYT